MEFVKIADSNKKNYMELLLIADEQEDMIEKYLCRGDMFAFIDDGVKAVCVVTEEKPGVYEIKNIAVIPKFQRKGYGLRLMSFIADYYKNRAREMYVGTGDCPWILRFYERCGFEKSHIVKNFFTDNYDHPIYDTEVLLTDMIYLKRNL